MESCDWDVGHTRGESIGKVGLRFIKKIYQLEDEIKELSTEARFYFRVSNSLTRVKEFEEWILDKSKKVNPESLAGRALKYTRNEWSSLINSFTNGEYKFDNNYIESHIRPFTIGCKNLMFSVKPDSAVENAKGNGLDPFDYLNIVFTKL